MTPHIFGLSSYKNGVLLTEMGKICEEQILGVGENKELDFGYVTFRISQLSISKLWGN